MAKIKTLSWDPSNAPDVTGYFLYADNLQDDTDMANSQKIDVGNVTTVQLNDVLQNVDGLYDLGISAYDEEGNEGPMAVLENVPLDFIAPPAPTNLRIS